MFENARSFRSYRRIELRAAQRGQNLIGCGRECGVAAALHFDGRQAADARRGTLHRKCERGHSRQSDQGEEAVLDADDVPMKAVDRRIADSA